MTWSALRPSEQAPGLKIKPCDVLYAFDGPRIFVAKFGFLSAFFVNIEDEDDRQTWLSASTDKATVDLVRTGQLSVRGAFAYDQCWIIETSRNLDVSRYWACKFSDIDESLLPAYGVGINENAFRVPDTIEQSRSYFSIGFRGKEVSTGKMPFHLLKGLIDNAYDVSRKLLMPNNLKGKKSATFDFLVEPKVGSLILSIEKPIINIGNINRGLDLALTRSDIADSSSEKRAEFFEGMTEFVDEARRGDINRSIDDVHTSIFETVQSVVPDFGGEFSSVEFTARFDDGVQSIFIDEQTGRRLHKAFNQKSYSKAARTGTIVEINSESMTFLIKLSSDRLVTCVLQTELFEDLRINEMFAIGYRINVRGDFERRSRRDRIFVQAAQIVA